MPLLPAGFYDLLTPQAQQHANAVAQLIECFYHFGYDRVATPLIEHEDQQNQHTVSDLSFSVLDPSTKQMLQLRADITGQIARIARSQLKETTQPLRLCYAGQVVRMQAEEGKHIRERTQTGLELIGRDDLYADSEVITIALTSLSRLGIDGLHVDCTVPQLITTLLETDELNHETKIELRHAFAKKDLEKANTLMPKHKELFALLAAPELDLKALALHKETIGEENYQTCEALEQVTNELNRTIPGLSFSIDLMESRHLGYHNGIAFSIFAKGIDTEIGKGGRYRINQKTSAVGATFYIDALSHFLPSIKEKETISIPLDTPKDELEKLQKTYRTIYQKM